MKCIRRQHNKGFTLIEILISLVIIAVAVVGAVMFRYFSANNARISDVHTGAGQVCLLILEGWKGAGGHTDYNPNTEIGPEIQASSDISIGTISSGQYPVQLTGGTNTYYFVSLAYDEDVDGDGTDDSGIRKLTVAVTYYGSGSQNKTGYAKTVKVSDFVRVY
ncbi:MAG: prepilin-type N-terminal cleavage/methylation domain-containing protein [Sedimentisphaerales bacterium]|nr:prepilin-type N-terminal cleavage/methylation domain-containing protein [Sedimentisphaerales bacterium]